MILEKYLLEFIYIYMYMFSLMLLQNNINFSSNMLEKIPFSRKKAGKMDLKNSGNPVHGQTQIHLMPSRGVWVFTKTSLKVHSL